MNNNIDRNDPETTEHEIIPPKPGDEILTDRDRDAGRIRTSGRGDRPQSSGRMPARSSE